MGKGARSTPFGVYVGDVFSLCRVLRCHGERLDVAELRQQGVLIVIAAARYYLPLLVKVADFAKGQRHLATGRLHCPEWSVVGAFGGELGDDNVSCVNVLGIDNAAVRESLGPSFSPCSKLLA